jgi:hypothetical protein
MGEVRKVMSCRGPRNTTRESVTQLSEITIEFSKMRTSYGEF